MNEDTASIQSCLDCIRASVTLIKQGRNEQVIRDSFTSYLRSIFPQIPSWLEYHIKGGESAAKLVKGERQSTGFIDNLVDLTAIEYESNLTIKSKIDSGYAQVKDYCASLVNEGNDPALIVGVLSDTVRWHAYRIKDIHSTQRPVSGDQIELEEIEKIDASAGDEVAASKLISFLVRFLGRKGSRQLNATSIAEDLGLESVFARPHSASLRGMVERAFTDNPKYAELIAKLWCSFVTYLRDRGESDLFDRSGYADEIYILTLAKLIGANVLSRKALLSDDRELAEIVNGTFFKRRGLLNLVEYDYFGWMSQEPYLADLLPVARALQIDLEAYDFHSNPTEDLFGRLMAQLARRTQRLLLGQEWTPNWLANKLVRQAIAMLPKGQLPRFIDMCCGSGAMVVGTLNATKELIESDGIARSQVEKISLLQQSITGFDIDPLAVILTRINWVLTVQEWLEPLGSVAVDIPVYHSDSLFAITPLSENPEDKINGDFYSLNIMGRILLLPSFLIHPEFQTYFDSLIDKAYEIAGRTSKQKTFVLASSDLAAAVTALGPNDKIDESNANEVKEFLRVFIETIDTLIREGRNGLWAFILRNSYRPALVTGQFNGLVSNPPWLALSKIADNPYKESLREKAESFGIKPAGPSFLHIELSTIFLLHSIYRYLEPDSVVGCIVPATVLNGYQHNPFRKGTYKNAVIPVNFTVENIWRVQTGTFKNEAIVVFGPSGESGIGTNDSIPGGLVSEDQNTPLVFRKVSRGDRVIWSDVEDSGRDTEVFFEPANFVQGADIMPRTLFFPETNPVPSPQDRRRLQITAINPSQSNLRFIVDDAKEFKDFKIPSEVVSDAWVFEVLISKLLTPFDVATPIKAILPVQKGEDESWEQVSEVSVAANDSAAARVFEEMVKALGHGKTQEDLYERLNKRNKLSRQRIGESGYLVFTGAGGKWVCSASVPIARFDQQKLIIDQTLYWTQVSTEDEAIYLSGLFNSDATNILIREFQPKGAFGERHVHTLAHGVTPPFNSEDAAHQDVVVKTRKLLEDYENAKATDTNLQKLLDPNGGALHRRRSQIREILKTLPSYPEYEIACRNVYGL